jgi:hypothetical protein
MFNGDNAFILKPAEIVPFDVGRQIHTVPDEIIASVGPHIRSVCVQECGPRYEAVVIRCGGQGAFLPGSDHQLPVPQDQRVFLRDLTVMANKQAHYNGFWVVAWVDANIPNDFKAFWFDGDGDWHLSVEEVDRGWGRMQTFGLQNYVHNLEKAIHTWEAEVEKLEARNDQVVKAAQGERYK